ncbi:flagellar export protein FliJ [Oceanicoccus sp. KOV_DT_Chl]|uniref:flagellar export protein FliJ n=1 Tax=Oceanicoccus sp. KOV_DT_Chl TaxID=1904639 RepID=UPI000C79C622|nr:flagellar export protein FliJ [Oceanicoccus sp. KOV_DT_Chl]
MAEKPSKRLQTVLRLAKLKEQQAAEKLANAIRLVQAQKAQLQQLDQYKAEYGNQFQQSVAQQLNVAKLANFQRFYHNLEQVGETQQERQVLAEQQQDQARALWQQQYSRHKNMQSLIERKQHQEQASEDKKLQREQDDRKYPSDHD